MMQQMASSNTILQTIVHDEKRGRVMALYNMSLQGMAPLAVCWRAAWRACGCAPTIIVSGVALLLGSALFAARLPAIRRVVRPIYIELGILPRTVPEEPPLL